MILKARGHDYIITFKWGRESRNYIHENSENTKGLSLEDEEDAFGQLSSRVIDLW